MTLPFSVDHCADSFALLRGAGAGIVDHVLTDPPYDTHTQNNLIHGTTIKRWVAGEIESSGIPKRELTFAPLEDYAFGADIVRVAARWALTFCSVEGFGELRRAVGGAYVRGGIWYKPNAQGQLTGDRPAACYEGIGILHAAEGKKAWNGRGSYALWVHNSTRGKKGRHPNEKPVHLLCKLLALFTNRGDSVFDPFSGSAAVGEACVLLGRRYQGLDADPVWVGHGRNRLASVAHLWGSMTDEHALALCTARKADILEDTP